MRIRDGGPTCSACGFDEDACEFTYGVEVAELRSHSEDEYGPEYYCRECLLGALASLEVLGRSAGEVAFEAYREARGGVNHDGTPTPRWAALGAGVRAGWEAAAAAVLAVGA